MKSQRHGWWVRIIWATGFVAHAVAALPPDVLAKKACGATVMVRNLEGRKSMGTGFFVYPDLLVTNTHVLESLDV